MLLFLSLVDITDGGRLVTEGIIHPVVNVSALTWLFGKLGLDKYCSVVVAVNVCVAVQSVPAENNKNK
jgi:hypothetical protein